MQGISLSRLAAVVIGNALEFYDFLIFGFFAVQIGQAFFPATGDTGLLLTLATFGVGFLTRPLGGVVIGRMGDRAGRKPAMFLSFGLMGFSIIGLAFTPSYSRIGYAAPLLAVLFRLVQGFALGGEVGPSTAYLMEAAPPHQRGFYVSLQFATQQAAILTSGFVGLVLSRLMSAEMLADWGWRIAMLIGASVVPFGLIMRRRLPETLVERSRTALPHLTRREWVLVLLVIFMLATTTISTYVMNYMVTFGTDTLGFPPRLAFGAVVATGICGTLFNPVGGRLADRFGFRPVMLTAMLALLAVAIPCFMAMAAWKTPSVLYAGSALMGTLLALGTPSVMLALSEGLPASIRSGGIGIVYAIAISVFGGSAQFIVKWLTLVLHSPLAPAWYMSGALVIGITARLLLPSGRQARVVH
ncbi:MAG TPA: MFS transporter [Rhizomicrobium sp.]|nr:MFS transporter [Rhizomicrobium sp.]